MSVRDDDHDSIGHFQEFQDSELSSATEGVIAIMVKRRLQDAKPLDSRPLKNELLKDTLLKGKSTEVVFQPWEILWWRFKLLKAIGMSLVKFPI
ncbi:hypothetical protein NL676_011107 [Syzygium grande]|nr:hypothetical protein NL676_011107 [Syzygium grande]